MGIEERIKNIDLNSGEINTDYRAAIHQRYSNTPVNINNVRRLLTESFAFSTDAQTTRTLHAIHSWMFDNFSREIITLSPLGVYGLDQVLTSTSSLKIAHVTGKPADVVADPTVQLTGEVYRRRKVRDENELILGTFHQCTRLQHYANPLFKPVFEMFGTVDSTLKSSKGFGIKGIARLVSDYGRLIRFFIDDPLIEVVLGNVGIAGKVLEPYTKEDELNLQKRTDILAEAVPETLRGSIGSDAVYSQEADVFFRKYGLLWEADNLKALVEAVRPVTQDDRLLVHLNRIQGLGHYKGLVFMIHVDGVNLADGGEVDWVDKLTANAKERTVVSGFGNTLLASKISDCGKL